MKKPERSSKSRKCLPSAEGFVRCAGPRGCALGTPAGGAPCTACLTSASGGLPGASLAEGQGCRGKAPRHPAGRLGSLRSRQGPCPRPTGLRATNPLDPPFTRKTRQRRAGRRGTVGWMGVKARATTAPRQQHDAQERPQLRAGGWGAFPQPPATWRTPRRCVGDDLTLLCFGVSGFTLSSVCNRPRVAQRIGAGGGARNRLAGLCIQHATCPTPFPLFWMHSVGNRGTL